MRTLLAFRAARNARACSSPQVVNNAATCIVVVPKSGFAIAVCPFQRGLARSRMESGISAGETRFLLTRSTRALAAKSVQVPSAARKVAGMSEALGETYGWAR